MKKSILWILMAMLLCVGCSTQNSSAENKLPEPTSSENNWKSPFVLGPEKSPAKDWPTAYNEGKTWGDIQPNDWGPVKLKYNDEGLRKFPKLPKAGEHPRILFTKKDIPDLRHRLKKTKVGKKMYKAIRAWIAELKGEYDNTADYTQPDTFKGSFGTRGFIPRFRANPLKQGELWKTLVRGDKDLSKFKGIGIQWGIYPLEALRCLIEKDEKAGKVLAKAIETDITAYDADAYQKTKQSPWGQEGLSSFNAAYTYDIAHKWLSPKAKRLLHKYIKAFNDAGGHFGSFGVSTSSVSNWSTFTYRLVSLLAIEGEEGFNDLFYLGHLRSFQNFFTYGWYTSGACYEGMGKNQLGGDALLMFALRGEKIAAHPHVRHYIEKRLPRDVLPPKGNGGNKFMAYGRWGGSKAINTLDAMTLKYLYPKNKSIDWVYRKAVGEDAEHIGNSRPDNYWNSVLVQAIFAQDPLRKAISQEEAAEGEKTFFCGERNLFTTRSSWEDDALFLNFQTRPINGGHVFADRNSFNFTGKGEYWIVKPPVAYYSDQNSLVTIDGVLQSRFSPGRLVDLVDNPQASFVVGDAKYTWDWEVVYRGDWMASLGLPHNGRNRLPRGGEWERMWETSNDFSYKNTPDEYLNIPVYEMPYWSAKEDWDLRMRARKPMLPVEKVFRTAGLVRGKQSYGLIVDDILVDGEQHKYEWNIQLGMDTSIWKVENTAPTQRPEKAFKRDIYLFKPEKGQTEPQKGQAVLMMRFLDIDMGKHSFSDSIKTEKLSFKRKDMRPTDQFHRLTVTTHTVSPNFKVMLYPFYFGKDSLPETTWRDQQLQIQWKRKRQLDTLHFQKAKSGKLDMSIERSGQTLVAMNKDVLPSPDRTPKLNIKKVRAPRAMFTADLKKGKGIELSTGKYDGKNLQLGKGKLEFNGKGHQQAKMDLKKLKNQKTFSIKFDIKLPKDKNCNIAQGNDWRFYIDAYHALTLKIGEKISTFRHPKEKINAWFVQNWAQILLIKNELQWMLYINGKLTLVANTDEDINSGSPYLQFGDAEGNVFHGMQGIISNIKVFDQALSYDQIIGMTNR